MANDCRYFYKSSLNFNALLGMSMLALGLASCSPPTLKNPNNLLANSNLPLDLAFLQALPASPSNTVGSPKIAGAITGLVEHVTLYSDAACTTQIGSGTASEFSSVVGITVTLANDSTTTIYGKATDASGVLTSGCKFLTTYIKKNTPPADPVFVSSSPASPGTILSPSIVGTSSADTTTLKFYNDSSCSTQIGTGSKDLFESTGAPVNVTVNSTTTIYAQAEDLVANLSGCVLMLSYVHNSVVPTLAFTSFTPASPANSTTTPLVKGTSSSNTATVTLYSDAACTTSIGSGTKATFEGAGIAATVGANTTTAIYGIATSSTAVAGNCTSLSSFTHDNVAPGAPTFTSTNPASPSNSSTTPKVIGSASSTTVTVNLYSNVGCTTSIGSGTKADFEGTGITAAVGSNSTTTIYAQAVDAASNVSACTLMTSYTHDTSAPTNPSFVSFTPASPSKSSQTPAVKGLANTTVTTVRLYSASGCAVGDLLASGTQAQFEGSGISISVSANSSTSVYAQTEDGASNFSSCTLLSTYVHDNTAPADPTFASFSPSSPATDASPNILGAASSDTTSIGFYSASNCLSGSLGSGTKAAFEGSGATLTVASNSATSVYAQAQDLAGNLSACVLMASYTHDNTAPAAPVYVSTNPTSPSNTSTTPRVIGTSSADTVNLQIFSDSGCTSSLALGSKAQFEGTGILLSVSANASTPLYAKSIDQAGNLSACTSLTTYIHDTVGPTAPTTLTTNPVSPNNSSTTPLVKGSASADTVTVNTYSDNTCATQIGTDTRADFVATGVSSTVTANQQTTIYVQAVDAAGNTSTCASASIAYINDTGAPVAVTSVTHAATHSSLTASPSISWSGGATDALSGFGSYEYSIGTSAGDTSIKTWTNVSNATSATATGLTLTSGTTYYANVRVRDLAGNTSTVTSSTGWVASGSAAQLVFITQPSTSAVAGATLAQQPTVEIRDSAGTRVQDATNSITLAAYTNATCTTASTGTFGATSTSVTATAGRSTFAGVNHRKAETIYIRASASGLTTGCSDAISISAGTPTKLGFTLTAGAQAGATIQTNVAVQDTYGNTVTTASDPITLGIFTNNTCTIAPQPTPAFTFSVGTNPLSATSGVSVFYSTMSRTGTFYLKASASGLTDACSSSISITAGPPTQIAFRNPLSGVITRNDCAYISVATQDANGNASNISGGSRTVTIGGGGAGTFYSNSSCTTPATTSTLSSGNSTRTFYYKNSTSESLTLTVSISGTSPTLTSGTLNVRTSYVDSIVAWRHSRCAIRDGSLSCWGNANFGTSNTNGQVHAPIMPSGLESGVASVAIGNSMGCAMKTNGELWCWGSRPGDGSTNQDYPVQIFSSGVTDVAAGNTHLCAIKDNKVYCWGADGGYGAIGVGTAGSTYLTPTEVTTLTGLGTTIQKVRSKQSTTCAVIDGGAWCWGRDDYGQIGFGSTSPMRSTPVQVSGLTAGSNVTDIAPGHSHTCAVVDGGVKCWGSNGAGQLGDGTTTARLSPVDVSGLLASSGATKIVTSGPSGNHSSCALVNNGIKCWGDMSHNLLLDGASTHKTAPQDVVGYTTGVTDLALGDHQAFAIKDGLMIGWGSISLSDPYFGNFTFGTVQRPSQKTLIAIPGFTSVSQIMPSASNACILNSDQSVYCAGHRHLSGYSTSDVAYTLNTFNLIPGMGAGSGVTQLVQGGQYLACVVRSGQLWCWGSNGGAYIYPNYVPARMDNVPGTIATAAVANVCHACALQTDGKLFCWGSNGSGAIGNGTTSSTSTAQEITSLGSTVTSMSAACFGGDHTNYSCAVSGGVGYCWGDNARYQLGDGTNTQRNSPTPVVGLAGTPTKIVASEFRTTCAILANKTVQCWGEGQNGATGDGITAGHTVSTSTTVAGLANVEDLSPSKYGFCARLTDTSLRCWGQNGEGQVGDGTTTVRATPTAPSGFDTASAGTSTISANADLTCTTVSGVPYCTGKNIYDFFGASSTSVPYPSTPQLPINWP